MSQATPEKMKKMTLNIPESVLRKDFPISQNIANEETIVALNEDVSNNKTYANVDELIAYLKN